MERAREATRASLGIGRLFEAVRDAVVIADATTGSIALWNPAAARLFGWTADEIEGKPLDVIIPPRYRARHHAGLDRYRRTGHGNLIDHGTPVLLPALHRDGHEVQVELMLSPLDAEERGRHVIAILRDVTERQRREADLRRANEDLEAFTYVVSHDLKEPVRALDAYLDELSESHAAHLPPAGRDALERAQQASARLREQLARLLEQARAPPGEAPLAPLDVAHLVRGEACRALYGTLAAERGATVLVDPDAPRVMGDAPTLCQALGNVIANAIRHNPASPPVVRVRGEAEGRLARILVEDNGPGFPEAVLRAYSERAFAPGAGPSGGFGLAIARRAVERQGGAMDLANLPGGGAVVRFTLPLAH